jgi:hypothetical protein
MTAAGQRKPRHATAPPTRHPPASVSRLPLFDPRTKHEALRGTNGVRPVFPSGSLRCAVTRDPDENP